MVKQLYFHPPHSLTTPSPMARSALTLTRQQPRVRKTVFVRSHYRHRPGTAPPPPPPPSLPHGPLPPIPPLVVGRVIYGVVERDHCPPPPRGLCGGPLPGQVAAGRCARGPQWPLSHAPVRAHRPHQGLDPPPSPSIGVFQHHPTSKLHFAGRAQRGAENFMVETFGGWLAHFGARSVPERPFRPCVTKYI